MKKTDELRKEYNIKELKNRVRGKYYEEYRKGTNLILLNPDVAKAFPTSEAVNEALKSLMLIAGKMPRRSNRHSLSSL